MGALRLLVVEGNTAETRARHVESSGRTASEGYSAVLNGLAPDAIVDVCFPADPGANLPERSAIADYDGAVITGSSLNLWKAEAPALAQVELAHEIFASQVPFFGSCWGLQVAAVAAGGTVRLNPKGREIGVARKITLTEAGRAHPMHTGRPLAFDAPTVHSDEVGVPPGEIIITAANGVTDIQAAEIRHEGGIFWGVQYHPEYSLHDIAATLRRYGERLIGDGFFRTLAELETHAALFSSLGADTGRLDLAWRLGLDADLLDPLTRMAEIANWLRYSVRPAQSRRVRG